MKKIALITRTFQQNKNIDNFNENIFIEKFYKPLKNMIESNLFNKVFILINTDKNNDYCEYTNNGVSPSEFFIKKYFKEYIYMIDIINVEDWGDNVGSSYALSIAAKKAYNENFNFIMNWSSEMIISKEKLYSTFDYIKNNDIDVIGFLRNHWWIKYQWSIAQNTAAIWNINSLKEVDFFSKQCDIIQKKIISDTFGDTPLLGMEDFHSMLQLIKIKDFKWSMSCSNEPIFWNYKSDDPKLNFLNERKIFRQEQVILYYIESFFPEIDPYIFLETFFRKRIIIQ